MAFDDNLIKISGFSGLYLRDSDGVFATQNLSSITSKEYPKLKDDPYLHFSMKLRINNRLERKNLTSIKMVGRTVRAAIDLANKEKEEIREKIKSGHYAEEPEQTFDKFWTDYTETSVAAGKMTASYKKNKGYLYNKWLKKPIGNKKFSQITTHMLQTVVNKMLKEGLAPSTADDIRKVFSKIFKMAIKKRWIDESPMDDVIFPEYDNKRDFTLSPEQSALLYHTMVTYPEIKFRAIFMMMLEGRRKDEILALTWDRVDVKQKLIYFGYDEHKGKENLSFELSDDLMQILLSLEEPHTGYVFKNPRPTKANNNKPGGKIGDFRKRWKGILKDIGLENEDITPHDCRHWIGNSVVSSGGTLEEVAAILGQGDTRSSKRYANVNKSAIRKSLDKVHDVIASDKMDKSVKAKKTDSVTDLLKSIASLSKAKRKAIMELLAEDEDDKQ